MLCFRQERIVLRHTKEFVFVIKCKDRLGSCEQFSEYTLNVKQPNKIHLRSSNTDVSGKAADEDNKSSISNFLTEDSFIAVAAGSNSIDSSVCESNR